MSMVGLVSTPSAWVPGFRTPHAVNTQKFTADGSGNFYYCSTTYSGTFFVDCDCGGDLPSPFVAAAVPPSLPGLVTKSGLGQVNDSLVRVLPRAGGRYAIEWQHAEYPESTRNWSRFWAIHGPACAVLLPTKPETAMP